MELQGLTNNASRANFSTTETTAVLSSNGTGTLSSGGCCDGAVCNCGTGQAAAQQPAQGTSSTNVQLSARALSLSQGVASEEGLATRPSAGISRLVSNAAVPRSTALALQAYQQAGAL